MEDRLIGLSWCALSAFAIFLSVDTAVAASLQETIETAISPNQSSEARVAAADTVVEAWSDSVPLLVQDVDAYYRVGEGMPYAEDATAKLIPLTDLLVRIVINNDGSVQKFRDSDTEKTIDILAAAAGGAERDLRFNASYILATVVDDDNLCVILHRLRNPKLGYSGQVNLLQIAISGTSSASAPNVDAAKQTSEKLKTMTEGKTTVLANLLDQIATSRQGAAQPLRADSYCARYDVETGIAQPLQTPPQ